MNWIQWYKAKRQKPEQKSDYTMLWESMGRLPRHDCEETIKRLVKAYLPGKHIQGSNKGKK